MKSKNPNTKKKMYRSPRLVVYGDFRSLTQVKGGTSGDGTGKPRTRVSGSRT
jgi:hypothetical protein